MSGRTAKATRREIRRAVGSEALGIVNAQTQAIDHAIIPNLNALSSALKNLENRVRILEGRKPT